jgi:putative hydrolase of the HAD superfamily
LLISHRSFLINPVRIQAVTFDVGGTLIEPWPSVGHLYAEVAERHGLKNISSPDLNLRFAAAWEANTGFDYTKAGWERVVSETFRGLTGAAGRVTFFAELYQRFAQADAWRVFPDVRPTLELLAAQGIRLGVISNWDERLRGLLERLQLQQYFETLAISCEVGFTKPSPVLFQHAATKLGVPAAAILHVGDTEELDLLGARAAGFDAVRVERGRGARSPGSLRSLAELPARLADSISGR